MYNIRSYARTPSNMMHSTLVVCILAIMDTTSSSSRVCIIFNKKYLIIKYCKSAHNTTAYCIIMHNTRNNNNIL